MILTRSSRLGVLVAVALVAVAPGAGRAQSRSGRLIVTVVDQTGLIIQNAAVSVSRQESPEGSAPPVLVMTGNNGIAIVGGLAEGRYTVRVEFAGFEAAVVRDVRVRGADVRRRITLRIAKIDETMTVGRDRQSSALDPAGSAFSTVLTREQIEALPDDPEELEAALKAMAPPGSTIRVDGFTGGRLPSKSQIRSIRLPRMDMFAAQNHGGMGGMMFIDIMTQPGSGPLRGSVDFNFLDDAFAARNVFADEKPDEQLRRFGFSLFGTIRAEKTSFSINGGGGYQYTSPIILAASPDGEVISGTSVRQPRESFNISGRLDHAISKDHVARVSVDVDTSEGRNLGVGGYNLLASAYTNSTSTAMVRLSENGPLGRRMFTESRLQLRWNDSRSESAVESPTIRVLDAFTTGGAQQRGGQRSFTFEFASDLDYVRGAHSWRTGVLAQGGSYRSDDISNYLGTYTFASLDDYEARRPSSYTRRIGDPNLRYSAWEAAGYVQDDWRVSRSLLLAAGVRYGGQSHVGVGWNLSPRITAAWSPLRNGSVTIRGGYGYFYDWIDSGLYKQTLLFDGERQRELNVRNPSYPDPGEDGLTPPTNKYLWSDELVLPTANRMNLGIERALSQESRVSLTYTRGWGRNLLRGRNLNAPIRGVRPDRALANVVELVGDAESRSDMVGVTYNFVRMTARRLFFMVNYTWSKSTTNTTGAFSLPANGDDLETEWGPSGGDTRHRFGGSFNLAPFKNVSVGLNVRAQSGMPYNITTGRDENGDGVFNDRPEGTPRNAARGGMQVDLGGRVSYAVGFGQPRQGAGGAGGARVVVSVGGGGGGLAPGFGGGAEDKRFRLEFYVSGQNLLNRVNYTGYSFVMTSPFFGQPVAAMQPRKLQVGVRFGF
ncbi:MAG: carboxypeptidase regulatory-like domain-containing protein [Acidobacteriota bacterium]